MEQVFTACTTRDTHWRARAGANNGRTEILVRPVPSLGSLVALRGGILGNRVDALSESRAGKVVAWNGSLDFAAQPEPICYVTADFPTNASRHRKKWLGITRKIIDK